MTLSLFTIALKSSLGQMWTSLKLGISWRFHVHFDDNSVTSENLNSSSFIRPSQPSELNHK